MAEYMRKTSFTTFRFGFYCTDCNKTYSIVDFSRTEYYPIGHKMYKTKQNLIFSNSIVKKSYTKFPLIPSDGLVAKVTDGGTDVPSYFT